MNKQAPSFTDLLNDPHFYAINQDYEWHLSMNHPAAEELAEYMLNTWNYKA